jgi:hypothetical protein
VAAAEGERREGSYLDGSQNPVFDAAAHWYPRAVRRMTAGPGRPMDQADGPGPSPELGSTLAPPPPLPTPAALRARFPRRARLCGVGRAARPRRRLPAAGGRAGRGPGGSRSPAEEHSGAGADTPWRLAGEQARVAALVGFGREERALL